MGGGGARRAEVVQDARGLKCCCVLLFSRDVLGGAGAGGAGGVHVNGRSALRRGRGCVLRVVRDAGASLGVCGAVLAVVVVGGVGCAGDGRDSAAARGDRTPMVGLSDLATQQQSSRDGQTGSTAADGAGEPENEIERQIRAQQLAMRGGDGFGFGDGSDGADGWGGSSSSSGRGSGVGFRVDPVPFPFDVHGGGVGGAGVGGGSVNRAAGSSSDSASALAGDRSDDRGSPSAGPGTVTEPAESAGDEGVAPGGRPTDSQTQQRERELAVELAEILRVRAIEGGLSGSGPGVNARDGRDAAMQEALRLVFLDAIEPGTASLALADALGALDPRQRDMLGTLRDAVSDLAAGDGGASGGRSGRGAGGAGSSRGLDAAVLADRLRRAAQELVDEPLSMPMVALCTRVESFGRYTPLASSRFMIGRTTPVLVYAEVEHFKQAPAGADALGPASRRDRSASGESGARGDEGGGGGGGGHEVRLSIELGIYPESGDPLVYHFPAERIRDASRRERRDFFVVRRIDIPPTLNTGSYVLKITLTDEHSGDVAERVIPFTVVADPSLLRR